VFPLFALIPFAEHLAADVRARSRMPVLDWIGKKAVVNHHSEKGFYGPRVVFAEVCAVPDDRLARLCVTFKQIPYQIEGL
jgi:hypothetical protein